MTSYTRTKYNAPREKFYRQQQEKGESMAEAMVNVWIEENLERGQELFGVEKFADMWEACHEGNPSWMQIWKNVQGLAQLLDEAEIEPEIPEWCTDEWDAEYWFRQQLFVAEQAGEPVVPA